MVTKRAHTTSVQMAKMSISPISWIARGPRRGIITLDLLDCTEVDSVASPTHPSSQDDVGSVGCKGTDRKRTLKQRAPESWV